MAQVSISVGDISVGVEDEDATAKSLRKVAVGILDGLIAQLEAKPVDDEDEGDVVIHPRCQSEVHRTNLSIHEETCHG